MCLSIEKEKKEKIAPELSNSETQQNGLKVRL